MKDRALLYEPINKEKLYAVTHILIWCTVLFCWILKLFGNTQFEIPIINTTISVIAQSIIGWIFYAINTLFAFLIIVKRKPNTKEFITIVLLSIIPYVFSLFKYTYYIRMVFEPLLIIFIGVYYIKDKWYKSLIESIIVYILMGLYQAITMLYKNINIHFMYNNFITEMILMIDYYLYLLSSSLHNLKKGGFIYDRWYSIILVLSKQKRSSKSLPKNQKAIQGSLEDELGFKIFGIVLSLFQFMLICVSCHFISNTLLQCILIVLSFFAFKVVFKHSYHAQTIIKCTSLALLIFNIGSKLSLPLYISVFINIIIAFIISYLMYVLYYFDKFVKLSTEVITYGIEEEQLRQKCKLVMLTKYATERMVMRYCYNMTIDEIANEEKVEYETIKQSLRRSRKKLKIKEDE